MYGPKRSKSTQQQGQKLTHIKIMFTLAPERRFLMRTWHTKYRSLGM